MNQQIPFRDLELLCAYLDDELSKRQLARLKERFTMEPELKKALVELRQTRKLLQTLPILKAPRNFIVKSEILGQSSAKAKRNYYGFRMVSAVASLFLILVLAGDIIGLPGMIPIRGIQSQIATIQETEDVEFPLYKAPVMEPQTSDPSDLDFLASEGRPLDGIEEVELQEVQQDVQIESYTEESDVLYAGEAISGDSEGGYPVESEQEMDHSENSMREAMAVEEGIAPEETEAPLSLESASNEPTSPKELNGDQGKTPADTFIGDEEIDTPEPAVSLDEVEKKIHSEEAGQRKVETVEEERSWDLNWSILRVFEIILGLIALGGGIMAVYFHKKSCNVS